jgi:hypothetical protein
MAMSRRRSFPLLACPTEEEARLQLCDPCDGYEVGQLIRWSRRIGGMEQDRGVEAWVCCGGTATLSESASRLS